MLQIRKRDGSFVPFDRKKIELAVQKAILASGESSIRDAQFIGTQIAADIRADSSVKEDFPTVEEVQDEVEMLLMRYDRPLSAKAFILYRHQRAELRTLRPDPSAIKNFIHPAKYGKYLPSLRRKETKDETIDRVLDMHIEKFVDFDSDPDFLKKEFAEVEQALRDELILPSMRSMQFAGPAIAVHHAKLYNCSFTHIDRPRVFGEILYLLLCGCGVGYSVQRNHIDRLPPLAEMPEKNLPVEYFVVPDDIIGWAECLNRLITCSFNGVWFEPEYTLIRAEGSPLKTSGGKAPGHVPLRKAIERIREILLAAQGRHLTDVECCDIICHSAECVLSGGIRRSSLICIFDHDSDGMFRYKNPDRFRYANGKDPGHNNHRQMVNISAMILRNNPKKDEILQRVVEESQSFGEPGFFFADHQDYGCNPCGEIGMDPVLRTDSHSVSHEMHQWWEEHNPFGGGYTGFSFCNLSEVNVARCDTREKFVQACRASAIIGTMQASYTDFPYLGPVTEAICRRDALIGVGLTGMCDRPAIGFDPETLRLGAAEVVQTNARMAGLLGIQPAQRCTTVKPSGTASLELGCVGSGIHPHHAKRYFRRITANPNESVAQQFREANPHMAETKPNGDWSITFAVEAPEGAETLADSTDEIFMERLFTVYDNWIVPGTASNDVSPGLTHNVSSTLVFDSLEAVVSKIISNSDRIAAMSFFPRFGDKNIPFIPRETCLPEDLPRWRRIIENYVAVPWTELRYDEDDEGMESACSKEGVCDVR